MKHGASDASGSRASARADASRKIAHAKHKHRSGWLGAIESHATGIRWISLVVIAIAALCLAHALPLDRAVKSLRAWIEGQGSFGPVLFGGVYLLASLLFVPGAAITLAAGAIFGVVWGTVIVSIASTATAALAFLIARHLLRDRVVRIAKRHPRFAAIDRAIGEGGWRVIALLRLSPAIPFSVGNYLYGSTSVGFVPYVLASWIAMLPGTLMYVYLGSVGAQSVAGDGGERSAWRWASLGVGLVATIAVTVMISRRAHRALDRRTRAREADAGSEKVASPWSVIALAAFALVLAGVAVVATIERDAIRERFSARSERDRSDIAALEIER